MIPNQLEDFLIWVKERTELVWSNNSSFELDEELNWVIGAKWQGLEAKEIVEIEKEFNLKFTDEHKLFLKILHSIDRKEPVEYYQDLDDDASVVQEKIPFFYNWKSDKAQIKNYLDWPYRTILDDVETENKVWLKSWGRRPAKSIERQEVFENWYNQAPKLIPLTGHRFFVNEKNDNNPILSVYGSDIIVYGWTLRNYLLNELEYHLGLRQPKMGDRDGYWPPTKELLEIQDKEYTISKNKNIAYWEEMIKFWSSGWGSFGEEYPYEATGNEARVIVKTYVSEELKEDSNENLIFKIKK